MLRAARGQGHGPDRVAPDSCPRGSGSVGAADPALDGGRADDPDRRRGHQGRGPGRQEGLQVPGPGHRLRRARAAGAAILLAAGRLANVEALNLEAVGIHGDAEHGIEVDDYLQTHSTRVYAIGDVLLRHPYTHFAEREAAVAFQNAVLRIKKKIDYSGSPGRTFVDPEVAAVGITEAQAERRAAALSASTGSRFAEIDRARIDGRTDGFAKVVATPSGKILGATVVGEDASMIIQEFVLAMERNLSLHDLAAAVPIYPTYAGVVATSGQPVSGDPAREQLRPVRLEAVLRLHSPRRRRQR